MAAVVALDPEGWYPFGPAKQGAVFVAALAALAIAIGGPGRLPRAVAWLWAGLLVWLGLAAALGADRLYAWIGTPERRLGWLTWALLAACAWTGARLDGGVRWFCRMTVIAGLWCGGYCLVELWWRSPVVTTSVTSRLGGPLGSAAYLGAALCLLVPVAVGVVADAGERVAWRVTAGLSVAGGLIGLVGSGTRAAWLACGAVGAVTLAMRRPSARVLAASAAVALAAVLVVLPRLDDVAARDGAGGSSRLAEWEVATRVIGHHPLFGAGPEGYRVVFADGVDATYEREYGRDVLPDRAHSGPLDLAAIGGMPAALTYVGLLATVAWHAFRALRRGAALRAGLGAAALAYLTQQLALFPLAELDPTFWLIAGALLGHSAAGRATDSVTVSATESGVLRVLRGVDEPLVDGLSGDSAAGQVLDPGAVPAAQSEGSGSRRQELWRRPSLLLPLKIGVGVLAAAVFGASVLGVAADRSARTALRRPVGSEQALVAALRAADLRPDVVRYHLLVAALHGDRQSVAGARAAVVATERAVGVSPADPIVRKALAETRTTLARVTGDAADHAAATAGWEALVADDQHCGQCWYGLGVVRLLTDDPASAQRAFDRAAGLGRPGP
ncbi:MAG TPA: O-antigen ligase family protein [Ilumatobacter sp.]|nr:O-antigen ligase family protein [Ilumatobacter sp.]